MTSLATLLAIFISFCSLTIAANIPAPDHCPCYTATTFQPGIFCPPFKPSKPCIRPQCIILQTTTIPAPVTHCPTTSTVVELLDCQTACEKGCATTVTTVTATTTAVCTTKATVTTPKVSITSAPYSALKGEGEGILKR